MLHLHREWNDVLLCGLKKCINLLTGCRAGDSSVTNCKGKSKFWFNCQYRVNHWHSHFSHPTGRSVSLKWDGQEWSWDITKKTQQNTNQKLQRKGEKREVWYERNTPLNSKGSISNRKNIKDCVRETGTRLGYQKNKLSLIKIFPTNNGL